MSILIVKLFFRYDINGYLYLAVLLFFASTLAYAEQKREVDLNELLAMDLRNLMDIDVSLVSRLEEKQFNAPAAVYVLTQEDIRRSGLRRIPELLRMVPGLHVAKLDANKWAVSSRNSATRFSSTMQVMIDGRHVYTPFYGGVYWESQDTLIEDIERIEVVRGPGGSLWGANAVDGIINIITKSAVDTQGIKAYGLVGDGEMKYESGVRYGGKTKSGLSYRVFAKGLQSDTGVYRGIDDSTNDGLAPVGEDANDDAKATTAGFRMDWNAGRDSYMFQGNVYRGEFNEDRIVSAAAAPNILKNNSQNLVFNWKRSFANSDLLMITATYDQIDRDDDILQNDEESVSIDLQHNKQISNHNIAWGLGYRYYGNTATITDPTGCSFTTPCFGADPEVRNQSTWSAFLQDRISITDYFSLIIGSKFEDNDYTGFEYQPTIRGLWTIDDDTTYWASVTRAVRVPDRVNTDGILDFGAFAIPIGDKDKESFINYSYELGYRKRVDNALVLDGTVFYSDYTNTIQGSSVSGTDYIYGFEGYAKYQYNPELRMELGYTYNEGEKELANGQHEPLVRLPEHSINLRSYYNLTRSMDFDVLIYFVGESRNNASTLVIPSYTRLDLRYAWRPTKQLDLSVLLTNLLDDAHVEASDSFKINTGVKRGAMLKVTFTK